MELNDAWQTEKKNTANEDYTNSKSPISSTTQTAGENVKDASTTEKTKPAEKPQFNGDWITAGGFRAHVAGKLCGYWFGWLRIDTLNVPTFWDTKGNSSNPTFSLEMKRRTAEFWD